jgi:PrtD family type I secretion system ABC transporter
MGRALSPVEQSVGNWRSLLGAREAYNRLNDLLKKAPPERERMSLPVPEGKISVEQLLAAPPGVQKPVLKNLSFEVEPGEAIGVLGQSGAGKSTLARVLVGVWPYVNGAVRLDGTEVSHWNTEELGQHIGYLPQDVELFAGTVTENIGRFNDAAHHEDIIAAAKLAGVHEMIQRLPNGYNTEIGEGGLALSGGQRQRIGLARAVYGNPPFIVLDEPNSNLDSAGEAALLEALNQLRKARRTIILITHKTNILSAADKLLILNEGTVQLFGPRDEVLARLASPRVVPMQGGTSQKINAAV